MDQTFHFTSEETICAPATIPGTGAISIIRVSGSDALQIAGKVVKTKGTALEDTEGYRLRYGTVYSEDGSVLDNVMVSVFRAPHSYTGEDSVEISCHASKYIAESILHLLVRNGARTAAPGEFTRRAFLNGKMDLAQAEAVADVIASSSAASHRVAMNQLKGGFSHELSTLREQLLKMTSLLELELDFSEEDVEFANRDELSALVETALSHIVRLTESFSRGNAIKNGVPVAIVGATNTGKSTLLNALLGEDRAIVSDIAGTTRDTIEEPLNIGGVLFRFIDTAGIRETDEKVEQIGIGRTFKKLGEAAVVLGMTDLSRGEDAVLSDAGFIMDRMDKSKGQRLILLLNKCDAMPTDFAPGSATGFETGFADSFATGFATDFAAGDSGFTRKKTDNKNVCISNKLVSFAMNKDIPIEVLFISAKTGAGISLLTDKLAEIGRELTGETDETLVTNIRHYEALSNAAASLGRVKEGLADGIPSDLVAQDLREALHYLGTIVGEITSDEVLGNIFSHFCVGK